MTHWQQKAVTDVGTDMLNELMAGRRLTVTASYGGTEKADETALSGLTDVCGGRRELAILSVENADKGKIIKVQIHNIGLSESYVLHQIGIFARLDGEEEQLLCIFQDERGVEIPTEEETPNFILEVYGVIAITNDVKFKVDLDKSKAIVTPAYLLEALAAHNTDETSHADIRREVQDAVRQALSSVSMTVDITLPPEGWSEALETEYPGLFLDVPLPEVSEDMTPELTVLPAFLEAAGNCGLCAACRTLPEALRVYAKKAPAAEIKASLTLRRTGHGQTGGNGVGYGMPAATADSLGGVKVSPGSGLTVDSQGNLSLERATDEEVAAIFTGSKAE